MASCSTDSKVKIWDLRKGKTLYTLYSHTGSVNAVDFSFAGDYFATGGDDKNLLLWKTNFYDSHTRENEMIAPKTKVVNDRVVKFASKVQTEDEPGLILGVGAAGKERDGLGNHFGTMNDGTSEANSNLKNSANFGQQVVEVQADSKINTNLDRIMNQMDKLFIMLRVRRHLTNRTWRRE